MPAPPRHPPLYEDLTGALDWWRLAGLDGGFDDQPARWISPTQDTAREAERLRVQLRRAPPPLAPAAVALQHAAPDDTGDWPNELAGFADWWLRTPWLDDGRSGGRVAPRGAHAPALMIVVPQPEADDRDRLLAGPAGKLLAGFLAAGGLRDEQVYCASALPRAMPLPAWDEIGARGLGRVLAHHVGLVAPERLLLFGDDVLSLLGNSWPNSAAQRTHFPLAGGAVPLLAVRSLDALLARPAGKREVWRRWLEWTEG